MILGTSQATPLPRCSQGMAANSFFQVTASTPSMVCEGGAGPTNAQESIVYTTSSGTCFARTPGRVGTLERATISVLRNGFLTAQSLSLRENLDYFTITGSNTRLDTAREIDGRAVTSGQSIRWFSNSPIATTAFTICVSRFPVTSSENRWCYY